MQPVGQPFFQYFDLDGTPLNNGSVWFGSVNNNPELYPVPVYWDSALTQPASQPVQTQNGFIIRSGQQAQLFCATNYSFTVRNKKGAIISILPNSDYTGIGAVAKLVNDLTSSLGSVGASIQAQSWTAYLTGGVTGAFLLAPSPALVSYKIGQRFNVSFTAIGNSTDTINISGLGAKNLKQYSATGAKIAPVIANGMNTDIVFDGTDFVILDQLPSVAASEAGKVIFYAGSSAPTGYLKANGNAIPNGVGTVQGITADFSTLYGILGTKYGVLGTLPDMRGQFARGFDDARGLDTGRVLGSVQADDFKSHNHASNNGYFAGSSGSGIFGYANFNNGGSLTTASTGGTETRPTNIALLACIKY